ncbi:VOC family protein [Mucilaginibacter sp. PAMB04274]|uniref:VOC family protein n=1 Tax=Mucilaginibacter sp. PAMB04274 TaxID=3138568 RepID=UPI0031F60377
MCLKINYIPVFVNSLQTEINFYTEKLGFELLGDGVYHNANPCKLVKTGDNIVIGLIEDPTLTGNHKSNMLLNTQDLLQDYHLLSAAGIQFNGGPQYSPNGLSAEFTDMSGNAYVLFEQRNYED